MSYIFLCTYSLLDAASETTKVQRAPGPGHGPWAAFGLNSEEFDSLEWWNYILLPKRLIDSLALKKSSGYLFSSRK